MRKTDISPMYNGEVHTFVYKKERLISRRCSTAKYMRLYIRKTDISPMFNGEVGASEYITKVGVSPMYNGGVGASVYRED